MFLIQEKLTLEWNLFFVFMEWEWNEIKREDEMELWLASGLAALSPHSLHQFIHSFFGFPRTAKKEGELSCVCLALLVSLSLIFSLFPSAPSIVPQQKRQANAAQFHQMLRKKKSWRQGSWNGIKRKLLMKWNAAAADGRCALITHQKNKSAEPPSSFVWFIRSLREKHSKTQENQN